MLLHTPSVLLPLTSVIILGAFSASWWLDVQQHPAVLQKPMGSWVCLYVCLSIRVESGIVADIEMDNLLPSDCDTFYQIKSQPINHRSVQSGHLRGQSVFQRLRVFSSHGCKFTPVRWSDPPSPSSGLFSRTEMMMQFFIGLVQLDSWTRPMTDGPMTDGPVADHE